MDSLKEKLWRDIGPQLLKFFSIKLPLTAISVLSLVTIRREFAGAFWAPWINSILTQIVEFWLLRNRVFRDPAKDWQTISKQLVIFWAWAALMATIEGIGMYYLEAKEWNYYLAYVLVHIPTGTLRFFGDRRFVFPRPTPSSP